MRHDEIQVLLDRIVDNSFLDWASNLFHQSKKLLLLALARMAYFRRFSPKNYCSLSVAIFIECPEFLKLHKAKEEAPVAAIASFLQLSQNDN